MKLNILFFLFLVLIFNNSFSNTGNSGLKLSTIEGKVVDKETNEALGGVRIHVEGSNQEIYSDPNGNFKIEKILPGEYKITLSYVSYQDKEVNQMVFLSGSSKPLQVAMDPEL